MKQFNQTREVSKTRSVTHHTVDKLPLRSPSRVSLVHFSVPDKNLR